MGSLSGKEVRSGQSTRTVTLKISDLDAVMEVIDATSECNWKTNDVAYFLAHDNRYAIGIYGKSNLLSFLLGLEVGKGLDIVYLMTHPQVRQQQLAEKLLQKACAEGFEKITLEVSESNLPALALYKKAGFSVNGTRSKYYQGRREALLMVYPAPEKSVE